MNIVFDFISFAMALIGMTFYFSITASFILTFIFIKNLLTKKIRPHFVKRKTLLIKSIKVWFFSLIISTPIFILIAIYLDEFILDLFNIKGPNDGNFGDIFGGMSFVGWMIVLNAFSQILISLWFINREVQEFSKIDNISQIQ